MVWRGCLALVRLLSRGVIPPAGRYIVVERHRAERVTML